MEHDIELLLQVWKELKHHFDVSDIRSAADDFIHVLMEHGIDGNELTGYSLEPELKNALREFVDEEQFEEEYDEDDLPWDDD